MAITLGDLRRFAVTRSFFRPTTLQAALDRFGFVQADPIRAPARAQDLTLRHRVTHYRAGDIERRYVELDVEEDVLINYGFVTRAVQALMHPRQVAWRGTRSKRVQALLQFVRERGTVHPREVDAHFAHGTVTNYWGGSSNATTHLMEHMHYYGLLRVVRRENGIRVYGLREQTPGPADASGRRARIDALVDILLRTYGPVPVVSLSNLVGRLRYAVPQWHRELKTAVQRARHRHTHARVNGVEWYWPADEVVGNGEPQDSVRLLAPFDPLVWDRRRFELFWGWAYRFEAYTPAAKRKLGYYALPLLWRDDVVGWGNLSLNAGQPGADVGYVRSHPPRDRAFRRELEAELDRVRTFLALRRAESTGPLRRGGLDTS